MLASAGGRKRGVPPKPAGLHFIRAGQRHGIEPRQILRLNDAIVESLAAHAQYVTVPAYQVDRNWEGIDNEHAAGAPMLLLTAWRLLVECPLPARCCRVRAAH